MRSTIVLCAAVLLMCGNRQLRGQQPNALVGTWKLVSASATFADGRTDTAPFGNNPSGILIYTADGRMAGMISYSDRRPLSADRVAAPAAERAEAFATFFAYAGRFSVRGDTIVHHVEIASVPNWVSTNLVRLLRHTGDRIILQTPPVAVGGTTRSLELVWERSTSGDN